MSDDYRERRRRQILDAAIACFDRHGLHGTTTDHIADEAGLSAGAFYRYFDGKDAIIEAIAAERQDRDRALLAEAVAAGEPREAIRAFVSGYLDWLADPEERRRRRVNVHVWAEALHDPRLAAVVARGLAPIADAARTVRGAALPAPVDAESLVRAVLALLQGFVLQQAWDPEVDLDGYRETVLAMVDALFR